MIQIHWSIYRKYPKTFLDILSIDSYFNFRMEDQNNKKTFIIPKTHTSNKGIKEIF